MFRTIDFLGMPLAVRSLLWAVLLPGFVAGYVPWAWFGLGGVPIDASHPWQVAGLALAAVGIVLLGACIREFAATGRGTLSPLDPPTRLVVRGLYRRVRNPMYLSVTTILLGEAFVTYAATGSLGLFVYWMVWFAGVNLFVRFYEEPALRARFGEAYERYTTTVGRWMPGPARGWPVRAAAAAAMLTALVAWVSFGGPACLPETCGYAVGSELRELQTRQSVRFGDGGAFATSLGELGLEPHDPDVTIELLHSSPRGWSARGTHRKLPGLSCVIWEGVVPSVPTTERHGVRAETPSRPYCDFPT